MYIVRNLYSKLEKKSGGEAERIKELGSHGLLSPVARGNQQEPERD